MTKGACTTRDPPAGVTTALQLRALRYLDDKMWSDAQRVGTALGYGDQARAVASGAAVLRLLARKGFVRRIEKGLWRITDAGRTALRDNG